MATDFNFFGPLEVREREGVGGGRGVFATSRISAGQLVMREGPLMATRGSNPSEKHQEIDHKWCTHVRLARMALMDNERRGILRSTECLHPRKLSELSPGALAKARSKHAKAVKAICNELEKNEVNSFSDDFVLLIILKMQFNAFEGGLFIRMAMVNHSSAPNLHKFQPGGNVDRTNTLVSEARAVRDIKEGEEVTWSYFSPILEMTPRYQNKLFMEQHYTLPAKGSKTLNGGGEENKGNRKSKDSSGTRSSAPLPFSSIHSSWPHPEETLALMLDLWVEAEEGGSAAKASRTNKEGKAKMEKAYRSLQNAVLELEEMLGVLEENLERGKIGIDKIFSILEANQALPYLGPSHIVKARVNQLIVKGCQNYLYSASSSSSALSSSSSSKREKEDVAEHALCLLETAIDLERIQRLYLPPTHIEYGATLADTNAALTYCLKHHKSELFSRFQGRIYRNFRQASQEELRLRRTSERIQALYLSNEDKHDNDNEDSGSRIGQSSLTARDDRKGQHKVATARTGKAAAAEKRSGSQSLAKTECNVEDSQKEEDERDNSVAQEDLENEAWDLFD